MFDLFRMFIKVRVLFMALGLVASGVVNAAEIRWVPTMAEDGFSVMTPVVNTDAVIDELVVLKAELARSERVLAQQVEQKKVTGSDNVLSLLLPGGLIYAAYKRDAYSRAVEKHELLSRQYAEISSDLVTFRSVQPTVLVFNK